MGGVTHRLIDIERKSGIGALRQASEWSGSATVLGDTSACRVRRRLGTKDGPWMTFWERKSLGIERNGRYGMDIFSESNDLGLNLNLENYLGLWEANRSMVVGKTVEREICEDSHISLRDCPEK
jgi:hypothetical protein